MGAFALEKRWGSRSALGRFAVLCEQRQLQNEPYALSLVELGAYLKCAQPACSREDWHVF
jgi:hypothetical protein